MLLLKNKGKSMKANDFQSHNNPYEPTPREQNENKYKSGFK